MLEQMKFDSYFYSNIHYGFEIYKTKLLEILYQLDSKKVFLATDHGLVNSGLIKTVTDVLDQYEIKYVLFSDVEPNPSSDTVMKGKDIFIESKSTSILAIGGGSVIDFAKCVGVIVHHEGDILDYRRGRKDITEPSVPVIVIPTTAGTGAEVTASAVISDKQANRKYIVFSQKIVPQHVILDPYFTMSLPSHIVAATGMDALVHAIESYVSLSANPLSEAFSVQAMKLLIQSLEKSYAHAHYIEARAEVYLGSVLAGFAFNNGKLGIVHSCSHPLSAHFNIPHGLANAVLLPYIVEFNMISNVKKFAEIARIFDVALHMKTDREAARQLVPMIQQLNENLGIPTTFEGMNLNVTKEKLHQLVQDALDDKGTFPFNPRQARFEDIEGIYQKVLQVED